MRYAEHSVPPSPPTDTDTVTTREALAQLLLRGPATASALADELSLTIPAVRRHLDIMVHEGVATTITPSPYQERGRGRPAKLFHLSDIGRSHFGHAYDGLAVEALRTVRKLGGESALIDFARHYMRHIVTGIAPLPDGATRAEVQECAEKIAHAFNQRGFAASVENAHGGVQICHHHCPVARAAHDFPALCTAEYHVLSTVLNAPLQRLSTIACGAHTCTTNISVPHHPTRNYAKRGEV